MLAKALGVPGYSLWTPLTSLIRSFLLAHFCSCPNCGSTDVVRDGYGERKTMPDIPMLECNDCGRDFCREPVEAFSRRGFEKVVRGR